MRFWSYLNKFSLIAAVAASLLFHLLAFFGTKLIHPKNNSSKNLTEQIQFEVLPRTSSSKSTSHNQKPRTPQNPHSKSTRTSTAAPTSTSSAIASTNKNNSLLNQSQANQALKEGLHYSIGKVIHEHEGLAEQGTNANPRQITGSGSFVEKMKFTEGIELSTFLKKILTRLAIDLQYPQDFAENGIGGLVKLDFYVNEKGELIDGTINSSGESSILRLYATSIIMNSLKKPLAKQFWAKSEHVKIPISLTVELNPVFLPVSPNSDIATNNLNDFYLKKLCFVQPEIFKKIDKYMPPVIPYPGGIYVDFIKLYKVAYNIYNDVPDPDKLRNQRIELTKQQLELIVNGHQP